MEKPDSDSNYLRLLTTEELGELAKQADMHACVLAELCRRPEGNGHPKTVPIPPSGGENNPGGRTATAHGRRGGGSVSEPKFPGRRRSGSLTIVRFSHRDRQGHYFWWALCDCQQNEPETRLTLVRQDHFRSGRVTSCGCGRTALMSGNRRARRQSGRNGAVEIPQQLDNKPLTDKAAEANLILRGANAGAKAPAPPTCQHGFKLIQEDFARDDGKARYCELCGFMNDMPAARSPNWVRRLAYENLEMTRGMAPATESPTSPNARQFSKTADKVWAGGKNNVLVGGSAELGIVDDIRQIEETIGGRRRSASGRDKVRPWQNPNVDFDQTADTADGRLVSYNEPGHRDFDRGIDNRVAEKPEELFDQQTFGGDGLDEDETSVFKHELDEKLVHEDALETMVDCDEGASDSENLVCPTLCK